MNHHRVVEESMFVTFAESLEGGEGFGLADDSDLSGMKIKGTDLAW